MGRKTSGSQNIKCDMQWYAGLAECERFKQCFDDCVMGKRMVLGCAFGSWYDAQFRSRKLIAPTVRKKLTLILVHKLRT